MPEETSDTSLAAEPAASHLWRDASLVLAAATLWLYVMAAMYARGYLRFFNADAHWFDPSVFQLISFCALPILTALAMTAVGVFLTLRARDAAGVRSDSWRVWYRGWASVTALLAAFAVLCRILVFQWSSTGGTVWMVVTTLLFLALPRAALPERWLFTRVGLRFRWKFLREARRRERHWRKRPFLSLLIAAQLVVAGAIAESLGVAVASYDVMRYTDSRFRALDVEDERGRSVLLLFTDGVRSLTIEEADKQAHMYYHRGEGQSALILSWPAQAETLRQHLENQPRPVTQPGRHSTSRSEP